MTLDLDLDVDTPEKVSAILHHAIARYEESHSELQSAWQDPNAGRIWHKIAVIFERAARSVDRAIQSEGGRRVS